jgi:hypothetical protein
MFIVKINCFLVKVMIKLMGNEREFMKKLMAVLALCIAPYALHAASAGQAGAADSARTTAVGNSSASNRGYQGLASAYQMNQRNTYYMITQPDVDSACRDRIYKCLADYCGDVAIVPGQVSSRCTYATESELYNFALMCLSKDNSVLLPQYNTNTKTGSGGMNSAARICPPYVQQELMSYLSMANMSEQLSKSRSSLCIQRRQELEAAMSCHSVALAYSSETSSQLNSMLNDYCGNGIPGGSSEMVQRFATAGNVGANIWGWAEKMVSLEMNKKGDNWQAAIDGVVAGYTNRMNLACGENLQVQTVSYSSGKSSGQPTALQTAAALAVGAAFPGPKPDANPNYANSIWLEVWLASDVYNYAEAKQVAAAALSNSPLTQNSYLSSGQMDDMQTAYKRGTKVFILRDSARCYMVQIPGTTLTSNETSLVSQSFAGCVSR